MIILEVYLFYSTPYANKSVISTDVILMWKPYSAPKIFKAIFIILNKKINL